MRNAHRAVQHIFLAIAVGLALSLVLSEALTLGNTPVAGVMGGALLGLVNFASLYSFTRRILYKIGRSAGSVANDGAMASQKAGSWRVAVSPGLRLSMIVAGLAAIAQWFGLIGLLLSAVMFFVVQIPLFVWLADVARGRTADVGSSRR